MNNPGTIDVSTVRTVTGVWLLSLVGSAYLILPSGILTIIRQDFVISATAAGWIVSIPYAAEVVASMPVGLGVNKFGERRTVVAAAIGLIVANLWGWYAGAAIDYPSLLLSRFLGGIAFAALWVASLDIVTQATDDRTATAVGVYTTSGPAGLAVGIAGTPLLIRYLSWPAAFGVFAGLTVVTLGVFWVTTPALESSVEGEAYSAWEALRTIFGNENLRLVAVMTFVAYSLFLFFSGWMPTYLSTTFGLDLEQSGLYVALFPAIGILARSGGGFVSDYFLDQRRRPVVRASFLVSLPVVAGVAVATDVFLVIVLIVVGGFFIQLGVGVFFSFGPEFASPEVTSSVVAFLTMTGLLGSFTAPIITGMLIDVTSGFEAAFAYAVLLSLFGILAAWRIARGAGPSR